MFAVRLRILENFFEALAVLGHIVDDLFVKLLLDAVTRRTQVVVVEFGDGRGEEVLINIIADFARERQKVAGCGCHCLRREYVNVGHAISAWDM